jgi:hypothetical protein
MFYCVNFSVTHGTTEATFNSASLEVSAGVIHQIDLIFPSASSRELYARVFAGEYQLIPVNRGEAVRGNDMVISTREFYELNSSNNLITVKAWNTHATDDLLLGVNIGILPKRILQPFSFEELLRVILEAEL